MGTTLLSHLRALEPDRPGEARASGGPLVRGLVLPALVAASLACVGPEDTPSRVFDLRVIAATFEPPEIMAPTCPTDPNADLTPIFALYSQPLRYRALVLDPAGGGRDIEWEIFACATNTDRTCPNAGDRLDLANGTTQEGELSVLLKSPAVQVVTPTDGGQPTLFIQKVIENDPVFGLGGFRVPVTLHVKAGEEEIYATKLMVYSCRFFEDQTANVTPIIPRVTVDDREWAEGQALELTGAGPFNIRPHDYESAQEPYVVPSFQLQRVDLVESWVFAYHADLGQLNPDEAGGTDPDGAVSDPRSEWFPGQGAEERDVRFWFVVRDGRGGLSWVTRTAHYKP